MIQLSAEGAKKLRSMMAAFDAHTGGCLGCPPAKSALRLASACVSFVAFCWICIVIPTPGAAGVVVQSRRWKLAFIGRRMAAERCAPLPMLGSCHRTRQCVYVHRP